MFWLSYESFSILCDIFCQKRVIFSAKTATPHPTPQCRKVGGAHTMIDIMKILYIFAIIQQISKFLHHLLVSLCYTSVTSSCHLFLTCFFPLFVFSEVRLLKKNLNKQLWKKYCKQSHKINHKKIL